MHQHSERGTRPDRSTVTGWLATLLCGALAFLNAATAREDVYRVVFVVVGVVLVMCCVVAMLRWRRRARADGTGAPRPPA